MSSAQDNSKPSIKSSDVCEELICEYCGNYPLQPIHGHYVCGECKMPTKCCEGIPQD